MCPRRHCSRANGRATCHSLCSSPKRSQRRGCRLGLEPAASGLTSRLAVAHWMGMVRIGADLPLEMSSSAGAVGVAP